MGSGSIIDPGTLNAYEVAATPIVRTKQNWSDAWQTNNNLQLLRMSYNVPSQDLDTAELVSRYGQVKLPEETAITTKSKLDLSGHWLQIQFNQSPPLTVWQGRIEKQTRLIHGKEVANPASGVQTWTAFGPYQVLRKIEISKSVWDVSSSYKTIGWLPSMNLRDERGILTGNRSAAAKPGPGTYVYGGTETWDSLQYLKYVLEEWLNTSDPDDPTWTIGPQAATLLDDIKENIHFGDSTSIAELLHRIVPRRLGIDFFIRPTVAGFEIEAFSLTNEDSLFGGVTLPKNPNTVSVDAASSLTFLQAIVEQTEEHKYSKLRVLGNRIVVCATFKREDGELAKKWKAAAETAYKDGTGTATDSAEKHDDHRSQDEFRAVYQSFGSNDSGAPIPSGINPTINADGTVDATTPADAQFAVRETLPWTPLREGFDYLVVPPVNTNPSDTEPPFIPPVAYIQKKGATRFIPCDQLGVSVSALPTTWGVQLGSAPNHLVAHNEFTATKPTQTLPEYTTEKIMATIAFRGDQRLTMVFEDPAAPPITDGVKEIIVDDAELWWLAPGTVLKIDAGSSIIASPGTGTVLRNDFDRMKLTMAGAIARYIRNRNRARVTAMGEQRWDVFLGHIMEVINDGAGSETIKAPITSIEWNYEDEQTTTLRTGYAS